LVNLVLLVVDFSAQSPLVNLVLLVVKNQPQSWRPWRLGG
jgi:hypothetical protein